MIESNILNLKYLNKNDINLNYYTYILYNLNKVYN